MKFNVIREHLGDKFYQAGDVREAELADVQHLVNQGVLEKQDDEKAEKTVANKAEKRPANKAEEAGVKK